jgi:hypothetical protein
MSQTLQVPGTFSCHLAGSSKARPHGLVVVSGVTKRPTLGLCKGQSSSQWNGELDGIIIWLWINTYYYEF